MTSLSRKRQRSLRSTVRRQTANMTVQPIPSSLPFFFYMLYVLSFFLHSGERYPVIAPLRPDLLFAGLVALSLYPYLRKKVYLLGLPPARALTTLIIVIAITLPFVQWPGSVLRGHWQPFVKGVLFFYFTVLIVDTPNRLRVFVSIFLACQIFRVLEPLYLHLADGYWGSRTHLGGGEFTGRLAGAPSDVINPNGLGFVIATSVTVLHFMAGQSPKFVLKLLYVVLLPALFYALILSMSRGGFLALLVAGWLIFRQSNQKGILVIVAVCIAFGSWAVMSDVQRDRYLSLVSSSAQQSGTVEGRIRGMINEFKLGFNRPLFGHGLGTTREAKANYVSGRAQAAHNLYAEVMIELGLVGFAFFLNFLSKVYQTVRERIGRIRLRDSPEATDSYYLRLQKACVTIFWMYAVFSFNYFGLSQDYWYLFGGLCVAFGIIQRGTVDRPERKGVVGPAVGEST